MEGPNARKKTKTGVLRNEAENVPIILTRMWSTKGAALGDIRIIYFNYLFQVITFA